MADQVDGLLSKWLRSRRFNAALPFVAGRVLDCGCGIGLFSCFVNKDSYTGYDTDEESLLKACGDHPGYRFTREIPEGERYDTIIMLAAIEHFDEPGRFLSKLKHLLSENGKIVLTTPHPRAGRVHRCGAMIGLFSRRAAEEHKDFIGLARMKEISEDSGFKITVHRNFLMGFNQLFVLEKV